MAINLNAVMTVSLDDAVTSQELKAAVDMSAHEEMGSNVEITDEIQFYTDESVSVGVFSSVCFAKEAYIGDAVKIKG